MPGMLMATLVVVVFNRNLEGIILLAREKCGATRLWVQGWVFHCLFTAVYSMYSSLWLWIYASSKAHNVNQSQMKQSAGITGAVASLFLLLVVSRSEKSFTTWTYGRWNAWKKKNKTQTPTQTWCFFRVSLEATKTVSIPHYRTVSLPLQQRLRGGILHDHTGEIIKRNTQFFWSSYRCLFSSCMVLLFTGFHIYPRTMWHIPSASHPPCWFRSCPFLSGFYPKASVGDRIILRVVINCISYFLIFHLHCASCTVCWVPFLWDPESL